MSLRLSILDQSMIVTGTSARDAIAATLDLAQAADAWGYHRYWLAEHHGLASLGDPCPEILLGRIGSLTKRIRIGTGGILLPYYAPFKVAEQFRMLEALFPNRLDLGLGRAPGGDRQTANAVSGSTTGGQYNAGDNFAEAVTELAAHLGKVLHPAHPHAPVKLQPDGDTAPELWILGSSDFGGALAAQLGLRFAFAHFINPHGGEAVSRMYRTQFAANEASLPDAQNPCAAMVFSPSPHNAVAVFAICADTEAEANDLAAAVDLRRLHMAYGLNRPIPTVAEAKQQLVNLNDRDRMVIERERPRSIIGTPAVVKARIEALATEYLADEVVVLTVCGGYQARLRSYELLARAFGLAA